MISIEFTMHFRCIFDAFMMQFVAFCCNKSRFVALMMVSPQGVFHHKMHLVVFRCIGCNMLQHIAFYCNIMQKQDAFRCNRMHFIAIYRNLLQRIASSFCILLRHNAICCNLMQPMQRNAL